MSSKAYGSTYHEKTDNEESNSQTKDSTKEDTKLLGKKSKRDQKKVKVNNEYCAVCKIGGNLLLCDNCVRSYHLECLKINEEDLPEGKWFCPLCNSKKDKTINELNAAQMDEKQRRRLIKNEKRRLWRMKKKAEQEAIQNKIDSINGINPIARGVNKHDLIDSILTNNGSLISVQSANGKSYLGVINRMSKLPLNNSKICLNITYSELSEEQKQNKSLSLPLLFPIPNDILKNFYQKSQNLFQTLKGRKVTKYIIENYNQENQNNNAYDKKDDPNAKNNNNSNININNVYEQFKDLVNINKNNIDSTCDTSEEIAKILKLPNSVKALNNIINENRDILKYNSVMRDYWNVILEKKSSTSIVNKHFIRYPINSRELYAFPDYHGLDEKYFNKTKGVIFPYFNGKIFSRIVNIYDFVLTFSPKLYISKFNIEELYAALVYSENYKNEEIFLLSSIHISLIFLLICELSEMTLLDLYNKREIELIMVKIITEHKKDDIKKVFGFIYYSWPELIRLFILSNTFHKNVVIDTPLLEKIYNIHDIISYNTDLNLEEKILVLEKLIFICYETNFVRNTIKDDTEKRNEMKKRERELDEQLRDIESKKKEMERQNQFTQPELRIEEINKKLKNLQQKNKSEYKKLKPKLEAEKEKFKALVDEMNKISTQRDEIIFKIANLKDEITNTPSFNKSYLGSDGRGYKYYYFSWMDNLVFMRVNLKIKNNGENTENNGENAEDKYEWRVIDNKDTLNNDLIDRLSDKGIEESDLKHKLRTVYKKISANKSKTENTDKKLFLENIEEIFNNQTLKYENEKSPLKSDKTNKFTFITTTESLYELVSEKIKNIEINITKYLTIDNRQWESVANRDKIIKWLSKVDNVMQFVSILLFFNERIKCPYKTENAPNNKEKETKKSNKKEKVLEDEKSQKSNENEKVDSKGNKINNSDDIIDKNGNLDPTFINEKLTYANRIRLWTKENESYNVEKIYLSYLRNVRTFPQLNVCLTLFDIAVNELNKRKEYYKKKEKTEVINEIKEDDNSKNEKIEKTEKNDKKKEEIIIKTNSENNVSDKRRVILKKKKLIDYNVECMFCQEFGDFLYCDQCPNVAHFSCTKLKSRPDVWICPSCQGRK